MLTEIGIVCVVSTAAATVAMATGSPGPLQILTRFDGTPSTAAVQEMQREMDTLYRDIPVAIQWHELAGYRSAGVAARIVFVHFEGDCRAGTLPPRQTVAEVALASVTRVDGQMLPLVSVACDRIAGYIWQSMNPYQRVHGDVAFGRALGRILAHELYHYLTGVSKHTHSELFRAAISRSALLAGKFRLGAEEVACLRKALTTFS